MSALGNYVHLSWKGYKKAGTYRDESNWKRQKVDEDGNRVRKAKTNYDEQVFSRYIDTIQNRARALQTQDLLNLEKEYNRNRLNQFEAFKRASQTRPQDFAELMKLVVKNADLGGVFEAQADTIAELLSLDDGIQNVTLSKAGEKLVNSMQDSLSEIKKIAQLENKEGGESFLDTLYRKIDMAYAIVKLSPQQDVLKIRLAKIEQELDQIEEAVLKGWASPSFTLIKAKQSAKRSRVKVPRSVAVRITNDIIAISKAANFSLLLKKIQGSFTEVMGASLKPMIRRLAINEINSVLGSISSPSTLSAKPGIDIILLDSDIMQEELRKHPIRNTTFDLYAKDGDKITFKTDYSTKNKADFTLDWKGKVLGVSAKSYDLSVDNIYDKDLQQVIPNYIHLHSGTSLLMFLLGMEQNVYSPIGTHMLNIFAQHADIKEDMSAYSAMRSRAEQALLISMLYSSLSGDLLGKSRDTFANVLMIEDKSKTLAPNLFKVRFYDVSTIVNRVLQNNHQQASYIFIKPALKSMTLANTKELSTKARITKVLLEARQIKFTVGLQMKGLTSFR